MHSETTSHGLMRQRLSCTKMMWVRRGEETAHDLKHTTSFYGVGMYGCQWNQFHSIFFVEVTVDKSITKISANILLYVVHSERSNDTDMVCCTETIVSDQAVLQGFLTARCQCWINKQSIKGWTKINTHKRWSPL